MSTQMEAGRDLDGAIAVALFGKRHLKGADVPEFWRHHGEPVESQEVWVSEGEGGWCAQCGSLPEFSTDIAAAWQVVEKMGEKGWMATVRQAAADLWEANFDDADARTAEGWDDTAPLAICRAALATLATPTPERMDGR